MIAHEKQDVRSEFRCSPRRSKSGRATPNYGNGFTFPHELSSKQRQSSALPVFDSRSMIAAHLVSDNPLYD
jgi:hypothetical protein